jgi:hypothetical protein
VGVANLQKMGHTEKILGLKGSQLVLRQFNPKLEVEETKWI